MKKYALLIILPILLLSGLYASAEEELEIKQMIEKRVIPVGKIEVEEEEKEKLSFSSYYEYSWIKQGMQKGHWKLLNEMLLFHANDYVSPYVDFFYWDRFGEKDYTINAGSYFRFKNSPSYARMEIGFGADIDYVYQFQTTVEYAHKLIKNLYWQAGYRFLNYSQDNVYIVYPGLIYYFGDHYIAVYYNASFTEGRGMASWGAAKGNFKINDRLSLYTGAAIGERLFDIYMLDTSKQYSFIFFGGLQYDVTKNVSIKLGGSYSEEQPSFIKRSADCALILKF